MKKRILSLAVSASMLITAFTGFSVSAEETFTAPVNNFTRFDFNNQSLTSTTDDGGLANSLTMQSKDADGSSYEQLWGDGTIKFEGADNIKSQYYKLTNQITLDFKEPWIIEWKGYTQAGTNTTTSNVHSTVFSSTSTGSVYGMINRKDGDFRFNGDSYGWDGAAYRTKDDKVHRYVIKNIPSADGESSVIYYKFDNQDFVTDTTDYKSTKLSTNVAYLFGPGWGGASNYKGEMDYFMASPDVQMPIEAIMGNKLTVTGGEGTAASPYIANVTLPYTADAISKESVDNSYRIVRFGMYTDADYTVAVESTDVSGMSAANLYMVADGVYYAIQADFKVDLTKDSAEYKFDFNGNFKTSADGLVNELVPTKLAAATETEAAASEYSFSAYDGMVKFTPFKDGQSYTDEAHTDTTLKSSTTYELTTPIVLGANTNWKISAGFTNWNKLSTVVPGEMSIFEKRLYYMGSVMLSNGSVARIDSNTATAGTNSPWLYANVKYSEAVYENVPSSGGRTVEFSNIREDGYSGNGVFTPASDRTYRMTDNTVSRLFTSDAAGNQAFRGNVNYVYIDTNVPKTSAMKFIKDNYDLINTSEITSENLSDVLDMINEYDSLPTGSEAYITRGEIELIDALKNETSKYAVYSIYGDTVVSNGGSGTLSDPVTYSVTVPYSVQSIVASDIVPLKENAQIVLCENSDYAAITPTVSLAGAYTKTVYAMVGNVYAKITVTADVDLTKDSAKYYFDFNNSLETSANGLPNGITLIDVTTEEGYTNATAYTAADENGNASLVLSKTGASKGQGYKINNAITLKPNKKWEIETSMVWNNGNSKSHGLLTPDSLTIDNPAISMVDRKPAMYNEKATTKRTDTTIIDETHANYDINYYGGSLPEWRMINTPTADGKANITAKHKNASTKMWSASYTFDDKNTEETKQYYTKTFTANNMFSMPKASWYTAYDCTYDYIYIDTDVDKTDAMEYLNTYKAVFTGGELTDEVKKAAVIDYYKLTDTSKAYLVRGEADTINGIKSAYAGEVILSNDGSEIFITNVGKALSDAVMAVCMYAADGTLSGVELIDVDATADGTVKYDVPAKYHTVSKVKAILVDGFATLMPLASYLPMK